MNLYVGNLNYKVREQDLRDVMEEYGTVDSVRIITTEASNAINALNGAEYVGRPMVVKEALPKN